MDDYNKMYNLLGSNYTDKFMKMKVKVIQKKKSLFKKFVLLSYINMMKWKILKNDWPFIK